MLRPLGAYLGYSYALDRITETDTVASDRSYYLGARR
jgi:hypothetical protein